MSRLLAWMPFLSPLPVWDYWPVLAVPLTIAISVVYKCVRCRRVTQVPLEAAMLAVWILVSLVAAAAGLSLLNQWAAR